MTTTKRPRTPVSPLARLLELQIAAIHRCEEQFQHQYRRVRAGGDAKPLQDLAWNVLRLQVRADRLNRFVDGMRVH